MLNWYPESALRRGVPYCTNGDDLMTARLSKTQ